MRIGSKGRPFYRVVAVDERKKRTGGYLELLGTYNPLTEPKEIRLQQDKIDAWVKKGAVMSIGFLRIIGQAPARSIRGPRKPVEKGQGGSVKGEEGPVKETTADRLQTTVNAEEADHESPGVENPQTEKE